MLLRLALMEIFCETACSSVFHIFCTKIANLHGVTLDRDRKSQGLVVQQSSRTEARTLPQKQSSHGNTYYWLEYINCHRYKIPLPGIQVLASPDVTPHFPSHLPSSLHTRSD